MAVPLTIVSAKPGRLPTAYWEHFWRGCRLPQTVRPAAIPDEHSLFHRFLRDRGPGTSLIEVGCAPGVWLHYFFSQFGYAVTGIDYAPEACEMTRRNLAMLEVPATILNADVFEYAPPEGGFDIVVSFGLIEHFDDLPGIVERLVGLVRPGGIIVSTVPNLFGPEGWVLRTVRPKVYAGHVPIRLTDFRSIHESAGAETVFANYLGGCFLTPPLRGTELARNYPRLGLLANLPAIGLNRLVRWAQVATGIFPRSRFVSPKLLYVGRKRISA